MSRTVAFGRDVLGAPDVDIEVLGSYMQKTHTHTHTHVQFFIQSNIHPDILIADFLIYDILIS